MREDRTIFDLSEEEYEDYEKKTDDETWREVTQNTNDDALAMMYPNGMDDE